MEQKNPTVGDQSETYGYNKEYTSAMNLEFSAKLSSLCQF